MNHLSSGPAGPPWPPASRPAGITEPPVGADAAGPQALRGRAGARFRVAGVADWLGKPKAFSGLGLGNEPVSVVLVMLIAAFVGYLAVTRRDVQRPASAVAGRSA